MVYIPPILAYPLLFNSIVLLVSLGILVISGSYFVDSLTSYARKLGMSACFVGMIVSAIATSSTDIATSIMGLMVGRPEIMSGVVIGGLVIELGFLIGWFSVLSKKIKLDTDVIKGHEFVILGLILLPYFLMLDGELTRSEGFVMVLSFVIYVLLIWHHEKARGKLKKQISLKNIWQDGLVFLFALTSMLLAARYVVFSTINLSVSTHIPVYILSITVLAFANALPDTISGTISILKGKGGEIGFGDSIGSPMIEVNLFTGIVAMIRPMNFGVLSVLVGSLTLMICATYFMAIIRKGVITRSQGYIFLGFYAAYIIIEISRYAFWG